jgi:CO/xanthine dehydrogenase FAD-binding subunit
VGPSKGLRLGAAVPLNRLLTFPGLPKVFSILLQACSLIGSTQTKNRGTVGGNICNAAPSADSAPPLLCLGARVVLASSKATRTIVLEGFFLAPGKSALTDQDLPRIEALIVEIGSARGVYGLRHVGEPPMIPVLAAVANAVHSATGVRFKELLLTPEVVLKGLKGPLNKILVRS